MGGVPSWGRGVRVLCRRWRLDTRHFIVYKNSSVGKAYPYEAYVLRTHKMDTYNTIERVIAVLVTYKWRFLFTFLLIFFVSLTFLSAIGFVPESIDEEYDFSAPSVETTNSTQNSSVRSTAVVEQPVRIIIPTIGINSLVLNPASRDIATLDNALLSGAVRYPGSSKLGESGNMLLFGHSSYLPVVNNQNYKAFNGIQKLEKGDQVLLQSEGLEYVYRVVTVREATASETLVDLRKVGNPKLTLSTCNSFGSASERFIVEADFVGSYPIAR